MENEMETMKLTSWADYNDGGDENGTDAWNLSDGSMQDYPGMTTYQVAADLEKEGWAIDDELEEMYRGTENSGIWLSR